MIIKTTTPSQSRNCENSVLSRPPHPPKVETVKNQLFQDHHTLPNTKPQPKRSAGTHFQAGSRVGDSSDLQGQSSVGIAAGASSSGFWGDLSISPGGVQAMQVLIPWQGVLFPSSKEGVQALIPRQVVLVFLARKECRHTFPGKQC